MNFFILENDFILHYSIYQIEYLRISGDLGAKKPLTKQQQQMGIEIRDEEEFLCH